MLKRFRSLLRTAFHAGEVRAEAVVDAGGKAHERYLAAGDVEFVRMVDLRRVAVRGGEKSDDCVALPDRVGMELDVFEGNPEVELHR